MAVETFDFGLITSTDSSASGPVFNYSLPDSTSTSTSSEVSPALDTASGPGLSPEHKHKEKLIRALSTLQAKACAIKDDSGVKIVEDVVMICHEARELLTVSIPAAQAEAWSPDFDHPLEQPQPTLRLNGYRIGSPGNATVLIANPGHGKSSVSNAICASHINPACDTLGFSTQVKTLEFIDTENSIYDVDKSYRMMLRRAGTNSKPPDSLIFKTVTTMDTYEAKRDFVFAEMENNKPELMILDGIADLLPDTNNLEDSNRLILALTSRAKKYNINLLCTIHGNPGAGIKSAGNNEKARGHIGSELQRKAEAVLMIKKDTQGVRTITTNFSNGKNRSDCDNINCEFYWSDDAKMFVTLSGTDRQLRNASVVTDREEDTKTLAYMLVQGNKRHGWTHADIERFMSDIDEKGVKRDYKAMRNVTDRFIKRTQMVKDGERRRATYSIPEYIHVDEPQWGTLEDSQ
jgi:hypothetical protein